MRCLLACHRDPFHRSGGSEAVVRRFARGLRDRGHDVTVATALEPDLPPSETVEAVEVRRFPQVGPGDITLHAPGYRELLRASRWDGVLLYGQNVWVTNQAVGAVDDIQGTSLYFPVGFYNLERAHARNPLLRAYDQVYYRTVQRHLLTHADVVAALTEPELDAIQRLATPQRLVRIPNGIDPEPYRDPPDLDARERFGIPPDAPLILNLGGDYPNKRLELAVQAIEHVEEAMLALAGPGTEPLHAPPSVRGLGFVSEEAKHALLHTADVLLLTSDFEGFGLVLLEALASGTPIVSTPVGVAPELAAQGGGRTAPPTPEALAAAIRAELDMERDPEELQRIAEAYDWEDAVDDVEQVLAGGDPVSRG